MNKENTIRRVMWGREEHPLTVFVPWDCRHHCLFCTTKREYETLYTAKRLEKNFACLKESLRRMLEYGFVDEVVFTGGEPLADVQRLEELIGLARGCKVFINTSLNLDERDADAAIRFLLRAKIDGISVSLPYTNAKMVNSIGYKTLERLLSEKENPCLDLFHYDWCRINSVVRGTETPEQIRTFLASWGLASWGLAPFSYFCPRCFPGAQAVAYGTPSRGRERAVGLLGEDGGTVGDDVGGAAEADAVDVEGLAEAEPGAAEGGIEGGAAEGGGFVGEGEVFEDGGAVEPGVEAAAGDAEAQAEGGLGGGTGGEGGFGEKGARPPIRPYRFQVAKGKKGPDPQSGPIGFRLQRMH